MEKEENNLYGKIFDEVPILSEEHLDVLLGSMSKKESCYYLVQACKSAFHRGAFSIGESEVLSKAIRVFSKNQENE